jgi:hypothetical protein
MYDKKLLVYFLVLFIMIITFIILYFIMKSSQSYNESFHTFDSNVKPNYVVDYENNIIVNDVPNYRYENITQYEYNRLFDKLEQINKNQKKLVNATNYNFYTQSTTDDKLRRDLDSISKYVIAVLNVDGYYDFAKTNYGDVEIWIDEHENEEIKYELFMWDKKNYFQLKMIVNIIKFSDQKNVDSYGVRDSPYIFKDFNIGYPFKDQMIPLPTEIIATGNFGTGDSTIRKNDASTIKYIYLNSILVQNSTLIVDYNKNKYPYPTMKVNEDTFSGVNDMTLEYVNIKNKPLNSPYVESGKEYNKWITLDEELKFVGQWPSNPPPRHWNPDGIYYYGNLKRDDIAYDGNDGQKYKTPIKNSQIDSQLQERSGIVNNNPTLCNVYNNGVRWSHDKEELQPTFNPTITQLPRNCSENNWLFDLVGGGTPNTFFGGGKR